MALTAGVRWKRHFPTLTTLLQRAGLGLSSNSVSGWQTGVPVLLKWNNAWGFVGVSIPLPSATVDSQGFFAMDVIHQTVHRRHAEFYWELNNQLVLVAQQKDQNGLIVRSADERGILPHVIWQWVP
jgi:hypothetical protein